MPAISVCIEQTTVCNLLLTSLESQNTSYLSLNYCLALSTTTTLPTIANMSNKDPPETVAGAAADRAEQLAKDLARAKEAGWTNPIPFQYDTVVGGTPAADETRDAAPWLSDAAVYQWDDEFGDVGEPNPELEKILFQDEYLQRAGSAISALSFEVTVQGPTKINPVRNVRYPFSLQ